jgi:hypothetical protein
MMVAIQPGQRLVIYEECSFLARGVAHVMFCYSPMESNKVAHVLASKAEGPQPIVWLEDLPEFAVATCNRICCSKFLPSRVTITWLYLFRYEPRYVHNLILMHGVAILV